MLSNFWTNGAKQLSFPVTHPPLHAGFYTSFETQVSTHTHTPTRMHTQAHTHTLFFYTQTCAHKPLHTSFLIPCNMVVPNTSKSTAFDTRPSFQARKLRGDLTDAKLPQLFTPDPHFLRIDPCHFVRKDHRRG